MAIGLLASQGTLNRSGPTTNNTTYSFHRDGVYHRFRNINRSVDTCPWRRDTSNSVPCRLPGHHRSWPQRNRTPQSSRRPTQQRPYSSANVFFQMSSLQTSSRTWPVGHGINSARHHPSTFRSTLRLTNRLAFSADWATSFFSIKRRRRKSENFFGHAAFSVITHTDREGLTDGSGCGTVAQPNALRPNRAAALLGTRNTETIGGSRSAGWRPPRRRTRPGWRSPRRPRR